MLYDLPPSPGLEKEVESHRRNAPLALLVAVAISLLVAIPLVALFGCIPVKRAQVCVDVSGASQDAGIDH